MRHGTFAALGSQDLQPCCLAQHQAGQHTCRSMLYGIMSATADRARATHSFQQKFYQVQSTASRSQPSKAAWGDPSKGLSPIQLTISNLGAARQTRSYEALTPVASLPPVHLQLPGRPENGEPALCHIGGTKLISWKAEAELTIRAEYYMGRHAAVRD